MGIGDWIRNRLDVVRGDAANNADNLEVDPEEEDTDVEIRGPLIIHPDGSIDLTLHSVDEARRAIKELRLMKKEYALGRRIATENLRAIQADYTSGVRRRGPKVRGRGGLAGFARDLQTASRHADRQQLDADLAPFEAHRREIDRRVQVMDQVILNCERYILDCEG